MAFLWRASSTIFSPPALDKSEELRQVLVLVSPGKKSSVHIVYKRGGAFAFPTELLLVVHVVSNIPRVVLPGYEGSTIIQNVEDSLCNDTVACPRKLEF